jgi:hypothetical protein
MGRGLTRGMRGGLGIDESLLRWGGGGIVRLRVLEG